MHSRVSSHMTKLENLPGHGFGGGKSKKTGIINLAGLGGERVTLHGPLSNSPTGSGKNGENRTMVLLTWDLVA